MLQEVDVRQIEKKVYLSFHNDGIWDLFIGLSFMGMTLGLIYNNMGIAAIIPCFAIVIIPVLKKAITLPRLGYVKFTAERENRERNNKLMLVYLMTMTAFLGIVVFSGYTGDSSWQRWIRSLALLPFGLVLSTIAAAVGFLYGIRRALFYAILIIVTFVLGHVLDLRPTFHFSVMGIPMSLIGLTMFLSFIINNPRPAKGDSNAA
jgi:hypothetical protein